MAEERKRLLIVDDSEIDRLVLKNIVEQAFEVVEVENGYAAVKIIADSNEKIDAILLDISMPYLDGFEVLEIMRKNNVDDIPVILITSEATKSNVYKAADYGITKFISKPFDAELVLSRLSYMFHMELDVDGLLLKKELSAEEIKESERLILRLKKVYQAYLENHGKSSRSYQRVERLMKILLKKYYLDEGGRENGGDLPHIELASKAAFFYNMGKMGLPDRLLDDEGLSPADRALYQSHTTFGRDLLLCTSSKGCQFFAEVCGEICAQHHERADGMGYPAGLGWEEGSLYAQLCSIAVAFDRLFIKRPGIDEQQFEFVVRELRVDRGAFDSKLMKLLESCCGKVLALYRKEEEEVQETAS